MTTKEIDTELHIAFDEWCQQYLKTDDENLHHLCLCAFMAGSAAGLRVAANGMNEARKQWKSSDPVWPPEVSHEGDNG